MADPRMKTWLGNELKNFCKDPTNPTAEFTTEWLNKLWTEHEKESAIISFVITSLQQRSSEEVINFIRSLASIYNELPSEVKETIIETRVSLKPNEKPDYITPEYSNTTDTEILNFYKRNLSDSYAIYLLRQEGNIAMLLAWYNNNIREVIRSYIEEPLNRCVQTMQAMKASENEINEQLNKITFRLISLALRNSSEREVLDFISATKNILPQNQLRVFSESADQAIKEFKEWGCQIARYRKPENLRNLSRRYTGGTPISLEDEILYGKKCFEEAKEALKLCADSSVVPDEKGVLSFLKTSSTRQGMRITLDYLINQHSIAAKKRGGTKAKAMSNPRVGRICRTSLRGYSWAIPLVNEIYELSRNPNSDITDLKPDDLNNGYELTYKYNGQDYVVTRYNGFSQEWEHGLVPLETLWPRLEELQHEVMTFPLDRENVISLKAFYEKVVETIWLLGNLTPTERGTGKSVEQWFTMAHLRHQLRTPVLKFEYPQIDVLDLTLPLSLYKKRFFEFFEIESLSSPIATMMAKPPANSQDNPAQKSALLSDAPHARFYKQAEQKENIDQSMSPSQNNQLPRNKTE